MTHQHPHESSQNNREADAVSHAVPQSFDEQFPGVEPGFKTDDGMMKAFGDYDCHVCGKRTAWFHFEMAIYICSQDCRTLYQAKQC